MAKKEGFTLDELSKEAREKALEELRESESDQSDHLKDIFDADLEEDGFPNDKVYFGLGYTQGDGVSFYGSFDLKDFLKKHKLWKRFGGVEPYVLYRISGENSRVFGPGSMDVEYELTTGEEDFIPKGLREIIREWDLEESERYRQWQALTRRWVKKGGPKEWVPQHPVAFEERIKPKRFVQAEKQAKKELNKLEEQAGDLRDIIQTEVDEMSRKLEKLGYDEIEYLSSDEALTEMAEANDWRFTKEGEWV